MATVITNEGVTTFPDAGGSQRLNTDDNYYQTKKRRGQWSWSGEYIASIITRNFGAGVIWRLPNLFYYSGGASFFVPYIFFLVFLGLPMAFLEATLGQYTNSGVLTCWEIVPVFKGLGIAMMILSALQAIYHNVLLSWAIYYLVGSGFSPLPWTRCDEKWSTPICNSTSQAATEFFTRRVHGSGSGYDITSLGDVHWENVLCLLLAWVLVGLCLIKGVKSYSKAVYPIIVVMYILLFALLGRAFTLPGAADGRLFLSSPSLYQLSELNTWESAANQAVYQLTLSYGGTITWSSFNNHKSDVMRDTVLATLVLFLTSVLAAAMVFSYFGYLAHVTDVSISQVVEAGAHMTFITFPETLSKLPLPNLWSAFFFLMMVLIMLGTQASYVVTITTGLMDKFPKLWKYDYAVTMVTCAVGFLLGLTMTTDGSYDFINWMDVYQWSVFILVLLEIIALVYTYTFIRYKKDLSDMFGKRVCWCCPWDVLQWMWSSCWVVSAPILVLFTIIAMFVGWADFLPGSYTTRAAWTQPLGWMMSLLPLIVVFIVGVVQCVRAKSCERLITPSPSWGPPERQNRQKGHQRPLTMAVVQPSQFQQSQPYPTHAQPYPVQAQSYPVQGQQYQVQGQQYQVQGQQYQVQGQQYQVQGQPYPVQSQPYPVQGQPYLVHGQPYQVQQGYPSAQQPTGQKNMQNPGQYEVNKPQQQGDISKTPNVSPLDVKIDKM